MNRDQFVKDVENRLTQEQVEFWPTILSSKDMKENPPDPVTYLVDKFLAEGSISLMAAKAKVAKTTIAVQLSVSIARGIPFLGRNTRRSPVLYLSLDADRTEITEVFDNIGHAESDQVHLHAGAMPVSKVEWLMDQVKNFEIKFVVIDTLQRFFQFENLNDYAQVTNTMAPVLDIAKENGVHLMFLHHAKKDSYDDLDSSIGSTALRGLASTFIHLKRLPGSERRILMSDQRVGKAFPETALERGHDGWIRTIGTRFEAEIRDAKGPILDHLRAEGVEMTGKEIQSVLEIRKQVAGYSIAELYKSGDIERSGTGKRGDPFRYSPAPLLADLPEVNQSPGTPGTAGTESNNGGEPPEKQQTMEFPQNPECASCSANMQLDCDVSGKPVWICLACSVST